ncbi:MAG: hypothetical protein ACM3P0_00850 [Acidobacteriota bacterium]
MKRTTLNLISIIFLFQSFSCKSDPASSVIKDTPGRRDYEWSVDTVKGTMLNLLNLWAGSHNDVWAVGDNGEFEKRLWHYDGTSWKSKGWWGLSANCVFGFGRNNVYVGGIGIWHFDGAKWEKDLSPGLEDLTKGEALITDIRGNDSENIWAVGFGYKDENTSYGVIYHRNLKGWEKKLVMNKKNIDLYQVYPTSRDSKCLIYGIKYTYNPFSDSMAIFEYDGDKSLKEIATGVIYNRSSQCRIYMVQEKLLLEIQGAIYEYNKGEYKKLISIETLNNGTIIGGRNISDIFIWQREGLAHYNGTDTQVIFKLKDDIWLHGCVAAFEKEIFFMGSDQKGDYYLVKGKLKD